MVPEWTRQVGGRTAVQLLTSLFTRSGLGKWDFLNDLVLWRGRLQSNKLIQTSALITVRCSSPALGIK